MERRKLIAGVFCTSLLAPAALAETKVEYMALFVGGKKLGHVKNTREVAGGTVTTTQEMVLTITRMEIAMTIRQVETATETADGRPLGFKTVQDMGILTQTAEGTVLKDGTLEVSIASGQQARKTQMPWPKDALLPEGLRLLSRRMGLKEGTSYKAKAFSGALLQAVDAEITIGPAKDVDLLGRVVRLTEAKMVMIAPTGRIETTSYVDENLDALKTIVPMMGMQMEMVACSKEVALSPADPLDFFDQVLVASPAPLGDVRSTRAIAYHIQPTGDKADLKFLTTPSQAVAKADDGNSVVTVSPAKAPTGQAFPYKGGDADAAAALKPTRYLQSDAKEIAGLARIAIGKATDTTEAAAKIESYVGKYISNKNLSVGYATALEVAKSRQGDCTEHAVLAAAMCRAAGIPAQVVTGLAYVPKLGDRSDVFVPHAWFRVQAGSKWIDYDAALRGFDAGHIALSAGDGEPAEFFGVIGTLGNFRITKVAVEP